MAKVAYNACYGGFSLSDKAIARYAELKGITLYPEPSGWGGAMHWLSPPTGDKNADDRRKSLYVRDLERDDPTLIQVIEELGDEANGMCARLRIENIPAGTSYRIDEYDGNESVMTANEYQWKVARD